MIAMFLWLVACSPQDTAAPAADPTTQDTAEMTTATDTPDTDTTPATAMVQGVVVGPDGLPREGVTVTLCHGMCRFADTDASGAFRWDEVAAQTYALHFTTFSDGGLADVLLAIDVADDEQLTLAEPVPLATLGGATPVSTNTEVEVAAGVFLTVDPGSVDLPPFGPETLIVAGAVPAAHPPGLPDGEILEVVYVDPFDATAEPGLPLRIENRWGLAPGETVDVWASSYADYAWIDGGTLTVQPDSIELTGGALPVLSTFVLIRRP